MLRDYKDDPSCAFEAALPAGRVQSKILFLSELLRDAGSMGALCSSSPRLAARIARQVDVHADGLVVELGGGTGAITEALLRRGLPAQKLVVIEKSHKLAAYLKARFPAVRVIHGDAVHIEVLLAGQGPVQALVSGLPLRSIGGDKVAAIVGNCVPRLKAQGRLVQFTYAFGATSPWLRGGLARVGSELVWGNLPPARVEVFARPD